MRSENSDLLTGLLRSVSRSFYLTLRVLPEAIRPQISLAYLLARATDTIADTEAFPVEERLGALRAFRRRLFHPWAADWNSWRFARRQAAESEQRLLERTREMMDGVSELSLEDQLAVRRVLLTIISGQELDLERFCEAGADAPRALASDAELDDYTYRVAGCVGEFWTELCRRHVFPSARLDDASLLELGVRFGKGLQLVNILRDLRADLARGRCYFPEDRLAGLGLSPAQLRDPGAEERFRPLYEEYLQKAREHLRSAWTYTNRIPYRCARVRLACAWPVLIGERTLRQLGAQPALGQSEPVKVSRREVRKILALSVAAYPAPIFWKRLGPRPDPNSLAR